MDIFCIIVTCLAIVSMAEPKVPNSEGAETDIHKLYASLEKRFIALEQEQEAIRKDNLAVHLKLNDKTLEERVQALEFQMENVHEDITVIKGEITVINSEQIVQYTQIQQIENDINEVQVAVLSLQETDVGLTEDIVQLNEVDASLDSRLSELEVDGSFAFHAALGLYTAIPWQSVVVFPIVNVNLGDGYNGGTGEFVTPVGGAGLYFVYVHFQVDRGEHTLMDIRRNGVTLCQMAENDGTANGVPGGSCAATVVLQEGKRNINIQYILTPEYYELYFLLQGQQFAEHSELSS